MFSLPYSIQICRLAGNSKTSFRWKLATQVMTTGSLCVLPSCSVRWLRCQMAQRTRIVFCFWMSNIPLDWGIRYFIQNDPLSFAKQGLGFGFGARVSMGIHVAQFYRDAKVWGCGVQAWEVAWEGGGLQRVYRTENKTMFLCGLPNAFFFKMKQAGNWSYLSNQKNPYFMQNERFHFEFSIFFFH